MGHRHRNNPCVKREEHERDLLCQWGLQVIYQVQYTAVAKELFLWVQIILGCWQLAPSLHIFWFCSVCRPFLWYLCPAPSTLIDNWLLTAGQAGVWAGTWTWSAAWYYHTDCFKVTSPEHDGGSHIQGILESLMWCGKRWRQVTLLHLNQRFEKRQRR